MRTAILRFALMFALTAPALWAQTAPAPPATPKPATPPKPAVAPRATARVRMYQVDGEKVSYLGIEPRDITPQRAQELKLRQPTGVEVVSVDRDSAAGKAGLKEHDVITTFNGSAVESAEMLRRFIRETPPGRKIALGVVRDGQTLTLNTELAARSSVYTVGAMPNIKIPPIPPMPDMEIPSFTMLQFSGRNGIMVEDLTQQLGDYFGAKNGEGVLVRSIEKGSPGESAGLKAGDVVVRVGEERIGDMGDWRRATSRNRGKTLQLGIIRDKREQTLSLTIPARSQASGAGVPESWNIDGDYDLFDVGPEVAREQRHAMEELRQQLNSPQWRQDWEHTRQQSAKELEQYMRDHRKDMEELQREMEKLRIDLKKDLKINFREPL